MVGLKPIPSHCPHHINTQTSLQNHLLLFYNFKIVELTMHLKKPMEGNPQENKTK
jgi:hypothetical protein